MAKYTNKSLEELARQLVLSPRHRRITQVRGIEGLFGIIEPGKSYPYDFVCYQITGYRNRGKATRAPLRSESLASDLVTLVEELTLKSPVPSETVDEPYRNYEQLAEDLQVSTKTIRRWRSRGLIGFRAGFEDGVSRQIYLQSTVERFVARNKALVERGAAFKQLSQEEKDEIVRQARALLSVKRLKLHIVAQHVAEQTGRAVETVRYTLRRHDAANPAEALYTPDGMPFLTAEQRKVWDAHQNGDSVATIAKAAGQSRTAIGRLIREMAARQLKADPPVCVYNELFDAPNADAVILDPPRPTGEKGSRVRPPKDLPAYLRKLYDIPLMTTEQEQDAFRRYNYLKFKAARLIEGLDAVSVRQAELDAVAKLTASFEDLRREITQANLRLVVSIAKKHVGWSPKFFEVISDGNVSLMRAVEKFDYARGFKFSTYASWAVIKNYARTVPEEHYHFSRYVTGQDELLDATADHREPPRDRLDQESMTEALQAGMAHLTERERSILAAHFGLFGSGPSQTLEEIGREHGVTKERVRQIERKAIDKLKGVLSADIAGLVSS